MEQTQFAAGRLGRFVAQTGLDDLTPALRHEALRAILNFTGCALGVPRHPALAAALRVLTPFSGAATCTVFARRERLDVMAASFVNAIAGNLLDYDDTHLRTVIHPTAPVAPALLALAEARGLPGASVVTAFVLGAEVECRIGNAVSPGHYARGWHITATCGVFGAAAAAAKLIGLDEVRIAHAIGIAASQSAGLVENLSTPAKNVGVGNAARNGVLAALFAEQGYTAAPASIEGPLGWARASGDVPAGEELTGELGERWEFARNTYKPYPCGIVMHAVIDACLALRATHALDADLVSDVLVEGDALLLARGDRIVRDARDARVSIHHCAAAALLWGRAGVPEFEADRVFDPAATALRARVRAGLDASLPIGAARVHVHTRDGGRFQATVRAARGSVEQPLGDAEIEAKVRDMAALGGSGCDAEGVIAAAWTLDRAPGVSALMDAAAARA